jgi:hypothetical protein
MSLRNSQLDQLLALIHCSNVIRKEFIIGKYSSYGKHCYKKFLGNRAIELLSIKIVNYVAFLSHTIFPILLSSKNAMEQNIVNGYDSGLLSHSKCSSRSDNRLKHLDIDEYTMCNSAGQQSGSFTLHKFNSNDSLPYFSDNNTTMKIDEGTNDARFGMSAMEFTNFEITDDNLCTILPLMGMQPQQFYVRNFTAQTHSLSNFDCNPSNANQARQLQLTPKLSSDTILLISDNFQAISTSLENLEVCENLWDD